VHARAGHAAGTLRRTLRGLVGLREERQPSIADGVVERLRRSW
jgi:hypothetical protein